MTEGLFDLNVNKEISMKAKSFFEKSCQGAYTLLDKYNKREAIRMLSERTFYAQNIDKIQLKMFLYKLHEFHLKNKKEEKAHIYEQNEQQKLEKVKVSTTNFLEKLSSLALEDYRIYINKAVLNVIIVQKRFRGHLRRLISKMEIMNHKLQMEHEKAVQRVRTKSISHLSKK